jgi:hypothetical protein
MLSKSSGKSAAMDAAAHACVSKRYAIDMENNPAELLQGAAS